MNDQNKSNVQQEIFFLNNKNQETQLIIIFLMVLLNRISFLKMGA